MSYISSNANRFYAAAEQTYGTAATIAASNRFPAVKLTARQQPERIERHDKTGTRTFLGLPATLRKRTTFDLRTYMTAWTNTTSEPAYGPLFHAALGANAQFFAGGSVASMLTPTRLHFAAPHGLSAGQAVTSAGDLRFVAAIVDSQTVQLNAPFSVSPAVGSAIGPTVMYRPQTSLPSLTVYDYWTPSTAVQRLLCGAAVDQMKLTVNGDFHEFQFSGGAADLLDTSSFLSGQAGLTQYPAEPTLAAFDYTIIPGHLGQAWLGTTPDQFFTLTAAAIDLKNNLDLRAREFGSANPRAVVPGTRSATAKVTLFEQDDAPTAALYQAARQRSPIPMMLQLGQQAGELFGIYMKSVIPEVPVFEDNETRLQWSFEDCRAQGASDDELYVAFG